MSGMLKFLGTLALGIVLGVGSGLLVLSYGQSPTTKEMGDIVNSYSKYQKVFYCDFDISDSNVTGMCQTGIRK